VDNSFGFGRWAFEPFLLSVECGFIWWSVVLSNLKKSRRLRRRISVGEVEQALRSALSSGVQQCVGVWTSSHTAASPDMV